MHVGPLVIWCCGWQRNPTTASAAAAPAAAAAAAAVAAAAAAAAAAGLCDEAILAPSLAHPNEIPRYKTACVGSVHPVVRRKWSWREGSVTAEERAAEEAERSAYPSQESLIAALYKLA